MSFNTKSEKISEANGFALPSVNKNSNSDLELEKKKKLLSRRRSSASIGKSKIFVQLYIFFTIRFSNFSRNLKNKKNFLKEFEITLM